MTNSDVLLESKNTRLDKKDNINQLALDQLTFVRGNVVDENAQPMINAIVFRKSTMVGTQADINGEFVLFVPEGSDSLAVYALGYPVLYKPYTVTAAGLNIGTLQMQPQ